MSGFAVRLNKPATPVEKQRINKYAAAYNVHQNTLYIVHCTLLHCNTVMYNLRSSEIRFFKLTYSVCSLGEVTILQHKWLK